MKRNMKPLPVRAAMTLLVLMLTILTFPSKAWAQTTMNAVPYIDADGNTAYCTDYTVLTGSETEINSPGWYVVTNSNIDLNDNGGVDVSYTQGLTFDVGNGDVNLILCDGAEMRVSNGYPSPLYISGYHVNIYGQADSSGKIVASGSDYGIYSDLWINDGEDVLYGSLTINGGVIEATGNEAGFYIGCSLAINGGNVMATGEYYNGIYVSRSLTIASGSVTATGGENGIFSSYGITINGGSVTATGGDNGIYSMNNNIEYNGGIVDAYGSQAGILAQDGSISLDWTNASDRIKSNSYSAMDIEGTSIKSGRAFTDGAGGIYTGILTDDDKVAVSNKTLIGVDVLNDADENDVASLATYLDGKETNIVLNGRTLYRNGDWNTLCLPFSMTATQIAVSDLAGAEIKELDADNSGLDNDGILTLAFNDATADADENIVMPGKPYIVRWDKDKTENLANIINPVFTDVRISVTEPIPVSFDNAKGSDCEFVGQFSPFAINNANMNEILMMGSGSTVGYSNSNRNLKCFRAHFVIPTTGNPLARQIRIDFNDKTTLLDEPVKLKTSDSEGVWYGLDGQRLSAEPKLKGVYIHNGKKVIIK